ncbi:hypothetical protein V6N13_122194 [Hibiscus sabdariffa]
MLPQQHNYRESITALRGCFIPVVSNFKPKLKKQIVSYVTKASSLIFPDIDNISGDDGNALLVILGLLLTATFQATLSPPGGVWQDGNTLNKPGTSVMDPSSFLLFYIPTYVVFIVTFFLTLALLKPFPHGFRTALQVLLAFLAVCFHQSISFIVPIYSAPKIISLLSVLVFISMVFMCFSYQMLRVSVSIVACWILPLTDSGGIIQLLFLFVLLYSEVLNRTIVVVGYGLSFAVLAIIDDDFDPTNYYMAGRGGVYRHSIRYSCRRRVHVVCNGDDELKAIIEKGHVQVYTHRLPKKVIGRQPAFRCGGRFLIHRAGSLFSFQH